MEDKYIHNFINKHTALGIFLLIVGCFLAGYFVGFHSKYKTNLPTEDGPTSVRNY